MILADVAGAPSLAEKIMGHYGLPSDACAWLSVVFAIILGLPTTSRALMRLSRGRFLIGVAIAAAAFSALYIHTYLHDQSRIIDATTYLLQARAWSQGGPTLPAPEVLAGGAGRFLLTTDAGLTPIFPPGYPWLLSLFERLHHPMWLGPILAAALVIATYAMAKVSIRGRERERVARLAALLSLVCGALRYHTADTMSHGLVALLATLTVTLALRSPTLRGWALVGALLGAIGVTRFASILPVGACVLWLMCQQARTSKGTSAIPALVASTLGALPFAVVLGLVFRHITGHAWLSPQSLYYALSDGPDGCFRYGFGRGVGCLYEHGEFVRAQLPEGYGLAAALRTTLRRLALFPSDVANFGPLLLPILFSIRRLGGRVGLLGCLIVLQFLAYAPFYFDGSFPGGGARMFADVLPAAHVLLASILVHITSRSYPVWPAALAALLFGCHASFEHQKLRDRDGGAAFLPEAARALPKTALLLVDNDAAFNLGYRGAGPQIRRLRGDAIDGLTYARLGQPQTFTLERGIVFEKPPLALLALPAVLHISPQSLWPAVAIHRGSAFPLWAPSLCETAGPQMRLSSTGLGPASFAWPLPIPLHEPVELDVMFEFDQEFAQIDRERLQQLHAGYINSVGTPTNAVGMTEFVTTAVAGRLRCVNAHVRLNPQTRDGELRVWGLQGTARMGPLTLRRTVAP